MATYKFDIEKRYGQFYANMRGATDAKPNLPKTQPYAKIDDVVAYFNNEIERLNIDEDDDTIIFRGIGHQDYVALAREIKFATY